MNLYLPYLCIIQHVYSFYAGGLYSVKSFCTHARVKFSISKPTFLPAWCLSRVEKPVDEPNS